MNRMDFRGGPAPLIALENIGKTYITGSDVKVEALRGISLEIYPGEFVAIMGASGSGKSTLMHILGCLDRPTAGSYRVAGQDVALLNANALAALRRDAFGFIFQSYNLLATATAEENVEIPGIYAGLPPAARKSRGRAASGLAGPGRPGDAPAASIVRRPAATGGHCPRPDEWRPDHSGGRAHRGAGQQKRRRSDGAAEKAGGGRSHRHFDHP